MKLFSSYEFSVSQEFHGGVDVFVHYPVFLIERHNATELSEEFFQIGRGFHRPLQVYGLGGVQQFDGQHAFHVVHYLDALHSGVASHAHMVLLLVGGRNGVDTTRGAELLVFADNGRSGVLRNHETGVQTGGRHEKFRGLAVAGN